MTGDSPQSMTANISASDQTKYMADRQRLGFSAILVMALTDSYIAAPLMAQISTALTVYEWVKPI